MTVMDEVLKAFSGPPGDSMTQEEFDALLVAMAKAVGVENVTPQDELKHRLNLIIQGIEPGTPVHWRGLR